MQEGGGKEIGDKMEEVSFLSNRSLHQNMFEWERNGTSVSGGGMGV